MSDRPRTGEVLALGADVVQRLIPHRRPLLMVDAIDGFRAGERPALWAHRQISANEPVFDGHFPGLHLWPGVYTIEGLGQSTLLLAVLARAVAERIEAGGAAADVLAELARLDPARRGSPAQAGAARPPSAPPAIDASLGVAGHIDVKLIAPVYAGQCLDYHVVLTHPLGNLARFDVVAEVAGRPVARGAVTGVAGGGAVAGR